VLALTGCGRASPRAHINLVSVQDELEVVVHQRLLAQGFDYDLRVHCGAGSSAFTYNCDVLALNPPRGRHVEWTEIVVCRAKPLPSVQRCSSSRGEALQ
jgi:hypothetical protein